ncbi:hypothetical protein, partial [Lentilactobacillus diolivorans]|uniref:hypothetical protein n=1 Tax=Lentilactobacillus diolivorans TaxID=179838 RepID=UPI001CDC6ABA
SGVECLDNSVTRQEVAFWRMSFHSVIIVITQAGLGQNYFCPSPAFIALIDPIFYFDFLLFVINHSDHAVF